MRIPCPATTKAFHDPSYWWLLILVELYAARAANKNGQEGMRVETACYICICKQYTFFVVKAGWLYHLGIFSVIFFCESKNDKVQQLCSLFLRGWMTMIQNDPARYDVNLVKQLLPSLWNQPRCSNGPPAMDSCDDTCDIERSMENLGDPAVNSDFPSSKTVLAGD